MSTTTYNFLRDNLTPGDIENLCVVNNGKVWKHVAGYRACGSILAIYKNEDKYCVHAGEKWDVDELPNLGYYDINLSYDDLLREIANTYDNVRRKNIKMK